MADEENPLGGGPFGVGPFGPLVGVVAVAATAFAFATVSNARVGTRTLFYQANIAPPVYASIPPTPNVSWIPPLSKAVPYPKVPGGRQHFAFGYPYLAVENTTTIEKWQQPLSKAVPYPKVPGTRPAWTFGYPYEQAEVVPFFSADVTTGRASSRTLFYQSRAEPVSIPPAVDNTVTPDKWLFRFQGAVPRPPVRATQPFFGYPYEFQANLTTSIEWLRQWQGPPRVLLELPGGPPFVPKEVVQDVVTPDKWLQAFRPPPRYWPIKVQAIPFVPREAVLDNTVTPDKWLFRFQGAVPRPPVRVTQPFLGYPYEAAANLTTSIEWLQKWQGPPRYTALRSYPYQPFVPREATRENTVTPDKWLRGFDRPTSKRPVNVTQPALPSQAPTVVTATPTTYWFPPLSRSVKIKPPFFGGPYHAGLTWAPFEPLPQVFQFVPAPPTYVTFRKYTQYQSWVKVPGIVPPSPITSWVQSPEITVTFTRTVQFPSRTWTVEYIPPVFGDGPAPEPERVVCVMAASRVATEPLLLREATVPVTLRTATVPELDRVVDAFDSEEIVQSNEYRDEPCPPFSNEGGIPGGEATPEVGPLTAWVQSPDTTVTFTRTIQYPSYAAGIPAGEGEELPESDFQDDSFQDDAFE